MRDASTPPAVDTVRSETDTSLMPQHMHRRFLDTVETCIQAPTPQDRHYIREDLRHLCAVIDAITASDLLVELTRAYMSTPCRFKGVFEIGDVVDRLHDATYLNPEERRAKWADEDAQRRDLAGEHRAMSTSLHETRQTLQDVHATGKALFCAFIKEFNKKKRRKRASRDHASPPTPDPGHLDILSLSDAELLRQPPTFWMTRLRLENAPPRIRLMLCYRIRQFTNVHGKISVPQSVHDAMADVTRRMGAADAAEVRDTTARCGPYRDTTSSSGILATFRRSRSRHRTANGSTGTGSSSTRGRLSWRRNRQRGRRCSLRFRWLAVLVGAQSTSVPDKAA